MPDFESPKMEVGAAVEKSLDLHTSLNKKAEKLREGGEPVNENIVSELRGLEPEVLETLKDILYRNHQIELTELLKLPNSVDVAMYSIMNRLSNLSQEELYGEAGTEQIAKISALTE